ncbi:hypothetical protein NP233_g5037 [Leucocoprinus birnbaumii]|uniref:DUF6534 domain-containing protein n=1 Tax=Leucocoprinus birnbaumii TaxID=56174 RepID=A0AAD5W012_9AGAR|nr:hypothetical protein NP233_g5037 [Leucocoprinus birnbaumii]
MNVIELVVHGFFISKVWQSKTGSIISARGDFAMGTAAYVTATMSSDYEDILRGTPSRFATAALGCAVGADWLITGSLVKFFKESKSQFPRTSHLLRKLIFYAVNMGLLTSLADVVVLILSNVPWPSLNFYQLAVFEVVGNLYANSLLACLNARDMVSEELELERRRPRTINLTASIATSRYGSSQEHFSRPVWATSETQLPEGSAASKSRATLDGAGIADTDRAARMIPEIKRYGLGRPRLRSSIRAMGKPIGHDESTFLDNVTCAY